MRTIRLLILEDDLETVSILLKKLVKLENELEEGENPKTFSTVVLSEYSMVEGYINRGSHEFDIVLLDRDDKVGGSFHALDFSKIDPSKIISISSIPDYNEEAKNSGVAVAIWKDYDNLEEFADQVVGEVKKIALTLLAKQA
ncbi:MAG TPA: hypothetical protein VF303_03950 [Candidatus Nanoarchaeia archaeon]